MALASPIMSGQILSGSLKIRTADMIQLVGIVVLYGCLMLLRSPTLRDIINKHLPHIRPICDIKGLDDIAAVDTIIEALVQDRDDWYQRLWNVT